MLTNDCFQRKQRLRHFHIEVLLQMRAQSHGQSSRESTRWMRLAAIVEAGVHARLEQGGGLFGARVRRRSGGGWVCLRQ